MHSPLSRLHTEETVTVSAGSTVLRESPGRLSSSVGNVPADVEDSSASSAMSADSLAGTIAPQGASAASSSHYGSPSHLSEAAKGSGTSKPRRSSQYAYRDHRLRQPLYQKLAKCTNLDEAWQTYQELLKYRPAHLDQSIPHKYLHSFAAHLVKRNKALPQEKIRTQTVFLRLLSVLNTIYYSGGQVRLWEWNALIECAGRGWRKTRMDDFQAALNVYHDMVTNRAPGSAFSAVTFLPVQDESRIRSEPVTPDVVTYTTLITIAGRTLHPVVLHRAEEMLVSSGLQPNRITNLVYLRYYGWKGRLGAVRSVLQRMEENGWELGIDGFNALIWAYGANGELEIAAFIYRVLRHNLIPSLYPAGYVQDAVRQLQELEGISVPGKLKPDAITYYSLIQIYAYHGHIECLRVFADMMTSPERITGKLEDTEHFDPAAPTLPNPILPIFRAIFLGFARHAILPATAPSNEGSTEAASTGGDSRWEAWTFKQLHNLFSDFIELPQDAQPNSRTVYWLLVAFAISSGYDRTILRDVVQRLEGRYGRAGWDRRVHHLRKKIFAEDFDVAYFERLRTSREQRRR
ncbi:hypothetical protein BN946_scf184652.g55 [Trametes cinnabarina]|uniref:Pentacotripeptide-repeat region of PRORP domain-containing protein n=1 Tax=Pycnoporus cinnabarinus TaxID=5643 RepID=A0A060S8L9_PYCCI|nr:hypothetical protein BN946_scf184652.g55 [Trametes cinnabarina]